MTKRGVVVAAALGAMTIFSIQRAGSQGTLQGLVAYYPLNGDGADASGNGHNGVVVAATPTDNRLGQAGQALLFDGTNSAISVPDATDLRLSTTDFTIAAWILETERAPHFNDCIISKRGPTGPGQGRPGDGRGWIISVRGLRDEASTGHVVYQVSGGRDPSAMTTGALSLSQWHHVAVVYHRDKSSVDGRAPQSIPLCYFSRPWKKSSSYRSNCLLSCLMSTSCGMM